MKSVGDPSNPPRFHARLDHEEVPASIGTHITEPGQKRAFLTVRENGITSAWVRESLIDHSPRVGSEALGTTAGRQKGPGLEACDLTTPRRRWIDGGACERLQVVRRRNSPTGEGTRCGSAPRGNRSWAAFGPQQEPNNAKRRETLSTQSPRSEGSFPQITRWRKPPQTVFKTVSLDRSDTPPMR